MNEFEFTPRPNKKLPLTPPLASRGGRLGRLEGYSAAGPRGRIWFRLADNIRFGGTRPRGSFSTVKNQSVNISAALAATASPVYIIMI